MNIKLIVAGGRDFNNYNLCLNSMKYNYEGCHITIISGNARGADKLGEKIANNYNITTEVYPADWDTYGKSAGYKRNILMATKATHLLAFWDGKSKGTKHMIDIAKSKGLPTVIIPY